MTEQQTELEATVELTCEPDGLSVHIAGAERLPAGTVITLSIVIGEGGSVVIPPAAVPAPEPARKRYIGGA